MWFFKRKKEEVAEKWKNTNINTKEEIMDAINEAYSTKEQIDSNIYIGKSKYGNLCLCLDDDARILNAFPCFIDKEGYINKKNRIKEIGLGEPDEMHLQIVSLFFCIDLLNYKSKIIKKLNKLPQEFTCDLFSCYIDKKLTVISTDMGKLVVDTEYVKKFICEDEL